MSKSRGFHLVVRTESGEVKYGFPSLQQLMGYTKKFENTPNLLDIKIELPNGFIKHVFSLDTQPDRKKIKKMTQDVLAQWYEENPRNDYRKAPFLGSDDAQGVDKDTLVTLKIPFRAFSTNVNEKGKYGPTINYSIMLDTAHPNYQLAEKYKQMGVEYVLSLPGDEQGSKLLTLLQQMGFVGKLAGNANDEQVQKEVAGLKPLILVKGGKSGKEYQLRDGSQL